MKGRTTPTGGSGITVLRLTGVKRERTEIIEYSGALTVLKLSLTAQGQHHSLRLVLRDSERAFLETGGDEVRITDLADTQPSTLKFGGRFRFEWWLEGKLYICFVLDEFDVLE